MSPYGISKKVGGDTPEADAWMERCIARVQAKGKDKHFAVLVCKAQYQRSKSKKGAR